MIVYKSRNVGLWKQVGFYIKKWLIRTAFALLLANTLSIMAWKLYQIAPEAPVMAYNAPKEVIVVSTTTPHEIPPVLGRIARCESGGKHISEKTGHVVVNKTQDVGLYQINLVYHGKAAADMGLNLFDEEDNETYALHLYHTQGTEPWHASAKCWR